MEINSKEWDLEYIPKEFDKYHDLMEIVQKTNLDNPCSSKIKMFFFRFKLFFKKKKYM